jgi:hypothetical protein
MKKLVGQVTCVTEKQEMHAQFTLVNLKGKENLPKKTTLKFSFEKYVERT